MIIITGASRGVGKYLLDRFVTDGQKVIGTYKSTPVGMFNNKDYYHQLDITDADDVENWMNKIQNELTEIVLINCAGISYNSFAHKADLDLWNEVIKVNLIGTFNVIRHVLPFMRKQKYGRIINFSSVVAVLPTPGISAYSASKSALSGLTKSLAVENASMGITVNNINLGYAEIGMGVEQVPLAYQASIKEKIPSGVFCPPGDIYETIVYLIKTQYINGASVDLNGGLI